MDQLDSWTAWLRHRYPLARKIPGCWAQHPELVEELTALWLAWQGAYQQPDAPLTAAADWHDRWLPGVLHRLEHGPFALDCSETHAARRPAAYADALVPRHRCRTWRRMERHEWPRPLRLRVKGSDLHFLGQPNPTQDCDPLSRYVLPSSVRFGSHH